MGLKDVLARMRLIELEGGAPAPPQAAARPRAPAPTPLARTIPKASASVDELLAGLEPPKVSARTIEKVSAQAAKSADGDDGDVAFESIYDAAGIKDPPHGFSALKVLDMLEAPDVQGLEEKARAVALVGFLKAHPSGPVPLRDIIQDAVRRDQALDAWDAAWSKRLEARAEQVHRDNSDLQAEIDAVTRRNREKMEANLHELRSEKDRHGRWQARKRIEENRLYQACAPFVEQVPVTRTGGDDA